MCERTQEFLQFVRQAQATNSTSQVTLQKKKPSSSSSSQGESRTSFNEAATDIARGIGRTSSLLAKLTTLVRRQGLFDDPTEEINNLIHRIKQDLDELNTKCDTAQQFVDSKRSYFSSSSASNQSSQHNGKVVSGLKSELMTTTKDFKAVLELRSHKMKDQQQKKVDLVGKSLLSPVRDLERLQRAKQEQQGGGDGPLTRRSKGPLPSPYSLDPENNIAWSRSQEQQAQQQLLLEPIATTQYYEAREQAVSEVERTIGELGQLFHRLSTMLAQQQELVERIDEDVENAVSNTQNARDALMKAYESVSSNRAMYFKIGAIIAAFVLFFVLFVL
eukprot:gene1021-1107_t